MSLLATVAFSQQKADIIASYQESWRDWQSDTLKTVGMTLLANNNESKYFNDLSLWSDSLSSTPDGKAQLQQIIMALYDTAPRWKHFCRFTKGTC